MEKDQGKLKHSLNEDDNSEEHHIYDHQQDDPKYAEKLGLIFECQKLVGNDRQGRSPLTIAVIGQTGCGKSSFLNTVFASFNTDSWREIARSGFFKIEGPQLLCTERFRSFSKKDYYRAKNDEGVVMPTFLDMTGFPDENAKTVPDLLEIIFSGRITENQKLAYIEERVKSLSSEAVNYYNKEVSHLPVDRIIVVSTLDPDSPLPRYLLSAISEAAKKVRDIPTYGVLSGRDKNNPFCNKAVADKVTNFREVLGLPTQRFACITNYCEDSDPDTKYLTTTIPQFDVPVLRFLKQVLTPSREDFSRKTIGTRPVYCQIMECQPCHEQNRNASAEYWCTECEEALCQSCKSQHKSFKVSRNHNVSKLSLSSTDKQKEDIVVEKVEWVLCTEHDDKSIEYFCIKHEKPCCILCKRKYHRHCCEVEKVEDVVDETKLASITEDFLSSIEKHKNSLTKVANKERSNMRDLEIIKENCSADFKNTRIVIEEHLDILQNNVEQEMNRKYEEDSGEINKRLTDLSAKFKYINDQHKMIIDISKVSTMSIVQKYSRIMRFKHLKSSYTKIDETLSDCNLRAITNYKMSYEKTEDSITIRINRNLKEKNNDVENFKRNKEEIESSSSIVELEQSNSESKDCALSVPVSESPLTFPKTNAPFVTKSI